MSGRLSLLRARSSVLVDAPLRDVWKVCRAWGRQPWMPLLPDGTPFDVSVEEGTSEAEIGAIRCSKFGNDCQIFEQLVAIDDERTTIKWKAVDHKDTISPFEEASFINFHTTLSLTPVTMSDQTFVQWEGSCYTEPQFAASMQETLDFWYSGGMLSLKNYASHQLAKRRQSDSARSAHYKSHSHTSQPDQHWRPQEMPQGSYREDPRSSREASRCSQAFHRPTR